MKHLINKLSALFIMLMCVSATLQAEIVHHEVCAPTLSSRGFTRECWENTETGKFYADASCTDELVGVALAKAVTYAKLPENPVTETFWFDDAKDEHLDNINGESLDLNWAVSTTVDFNDGDFSKKRTRYTQFTVKEPMVGNVRMVWFRNNPAPEYGTYYVEISVNGTVKYNTNQNNEGVFVVSLPDLKRNDVVRFAVKQTAKGWWAGGPTFKACIEYNTIPCTHECPEGSAICSLCGYVKPHVHTQTETCSLCGYVDPDYTVLSGYVGKDNLEDIKWVLNKYNVLTFSGKGEMEPYNEEHNAWRNYKYRQNITKVVIGEGITKLGYPNDQNSYFQEMDKLTEVSLPSTLKEIGSRPFRYLNYLTSITLPEGLETIRNSAFSALMLENIVIPASVTSIEEHAFYYDKLKSITLNGAPTIGSEAFASNSALTDVYLMSDKEVTAADNAFGNNLSKVTLHVHNHLYEWAKTHSPWNKFPTIVNLYPSNVEYTDAENNTHEKYFEKKASDNTFTLTDGYKNLTVKEDIPMQTLSYTRNFTVANQWQALYIPFEMQPSDWADMFDVAAISNFHEYTNENGETEKVELEARYVKNSKLLPNIPYLIRAKEAGEHTIILNDVTLKATEERSISCSSTKRRYTFTGTYDAIDGLQSKDYIFVSNGRLCKANDDTDVLEAMRWYLTIENRWSLTSTPSAAFAKPMSIQVIGEDEATGIENIRVVSTPVDSKASSIYSVTGVKLAKPQQGINIINGKKVLVK